MSVLSMLISQYEDHTIQKIIRFLLNKNVLLNFKTHRNKKLERMSTDFKLHSSNNLGNESGFYDETPLPSSVPDMKEIDNNS